MSLGISKTGITWIQLFLLILAVGGVACKRKSGLVIKGPLSPGEKRQEAPQTRGPAVGDEQGFQVLVVIPVVADEDLALNLDGLPCNAVPEDVSYDVTSQTFLVNFAFSQGTEAELVCQGKLQASRQGGSLFEGDMNVTKSLTASTAQVVLDPIILTKILSQTVSVGDGPAPSPTTPTIPSGTKKCEDTADDLCDRGSDSSNNSPQKNASVILEVEVHNQNP